MTAHGSGDQEFGPGSACWFDLGVTDTGRAADFYSALLGWEIAPPDDSGYRVASLNGRLVAALGPAEDPGPPYWTVYHHTRDAAATASAVKAAGGTVVTPAARVGELGISATVRDPAELGASIIDADHGILRDPTGAAFGLIAAS
jgi:predicted enzyme related to lactoylglutathione lyase